jgi:hypothetical protein
MAKAVVPQRAVSHKFGHLPADGLTERVLTMALEFLHEHQASDRRLVKA